MKGLWARMAAALCVMMLTAACAMAQAAAPFPVIDVTPPKPPPHRLAGAAILTGVGLIVASFACEHEADKSYANYLNASDPETITMLYDRTVRFDRLSAASLITGNVLIATGLALRFLHSPQTSHVVVAVEPGRCAVTCRF
jgi:hypothetical protein